MKHFGNGETHTERSDSKQMSDQPREQDILRSRQRQLQEPYPFVAQVVDEIVKEKAAAFPSTPSPENIPGEVNGLKTDFPTNYQASFGGVPKSMTGFVVKKDPGRL